jgi:hypothetical protein
VNAGTEVGEVENWRWVVVWVLLPVLGLELKRGLEPSGNEEGEREPLPLNPFEYIVPPLPLPLLASAVPGLLLERLGGGGGGVGFVGFAGSISSVRCT